MLFIQVYRSTTCTLSTLYLHNICTVFGIILYTLYLKSNCWMYILVHICNATKSTYIFIQTENCKRMTKQPLHADYFIICVPDHLSIETFFLCVSVGFLRERKKCLCTIRWRPYRMSLGEKEYIVRCRKCRLDGCVICVCRSLGSSIHLIQKRTQFFLT